MDVSSLSSSPDPIAIAPCSSPNKQARESNRGPLAPRSYNVTSPSKSMVLNAGDSDGKSPWRIKVTVEAEPTHGIRSSPARRPRRATLTKTVPLKDAEEGSPVKRKGKIQASAGLDAVSELQQVRKPTPVRQKITPAKAASQINAHAEGTAPVSDQESTATLGRLTPQSSLYDERSKFRHKEDESMWRAMVTEPLIPETGQTADQDDDAEYSLSEDEHEDDEESAEEEDAVLGAYAPGDATMLESEEFSMISVDSLTSNHREDTMSPDSRSTRLPTMNRKAHPGNLSYMPSSPPVLSKDCLTPMNETSSPALPAAPMAPTLNLPKLSSPLRASAVRSGQVLQNIVKSPNLGNDGWSNDEQHQRSVFGGFSTGTRRQLRESLHAGQGLAITDTPPTHLTPKLDNRTEPRLSQQREITPEERDNQPLAKSSSTDSNAALEYPTLSGRLHQVSLDSPKSTYDAMSWVQTGPPRLGKSTEDSGGQNLLVPAEGEQQTIAASKQSRSAGLSDEEVVVVSSDDSSQGESDDGRDIWQEEASRSLDDDREQLDQEPSLQPQDLFSGVVKPPRAKLPRTWRRTSAHHFNYSDSPEPEDLEVRKGSGSGTSRKTSGVLTPSTTEDEGTVDGDDKTVESQEGPRELERDDIVTSELTVPERNVDLLSPVSDASGNATSPDGEDTGLFWHSNLPNLFQRRQRPSTQKDHSEISMLSDLKAPVTGSPLKDHAESSPLRNTILPSSPDVHTKAHRSPLRMRRLDGRIKRSPKASSAAVNTPLRASLLKSSKVKVSPLISISTVGDSVVSKGHNTAQRHVKKTTTTVVTRQESSLAENMSLASDTRQLLNEMAVHQKRLSIAVEDKKRQEPDDEQEDDSVGEDQTGGEDGTPEQSMSDEEVFDGPSQSDIIRSYQEELNYASPTRIAVKFNDSSAASASMLASKKVYPQLFDTIPDLQPTRSSSTTTSTASRNNTAQDTAPVAEANVFSRLTNSFWSAITTTDTASDMKQTAVQNPSLSATISSSSSSQATTTPATIPDQILRLRRKYGLLPQTHPFTYTHIRTLHRMLNSTRHHASTSIIPMTGPLAPALADQLNTIRTTTRSSSDSEKLRQGQNLLLSPEIIYTVSAFMSLLLPEREIKRLEGLGKWGDDEAIKAKGWDGKGRHGSWFVFGADSGRGGRNVSSSSSGGSGKGNGRDFIEVEWVLDVVVEICFKEERDLAMGKRGGRGRGKEKGKGKEVEGISEGGVRKGVREKNREEETEKLSKVTLEPLCP